MDQGEVELATATGSEPALMAKQRTSGQVLRLDHWVENPL